MKKLLLCSLGAAAFLSGCATDYGYDAGDWGYYDRGYHSHYGIYDYNRPDPRYNGYYPENYYRNDGRYREHLMRSDERIYRGRDGRYYCRRADGTTGLIVGAVAGGVLGSLIAEGDSKPLGAVLGAVGGGAVGAAVDSNRVVCR